jgi:hypothetical protein
MKLWTWAGDGTKILGALGTLKDIAMGLMAIEGLIPPGYFKYIAAAGVVIGVLTMRRGYTNTGNATP